MTSQIEGGSLRAQVEALNKRLAALEEGKKNPGGKGIPGETNPSNVEAKLASIDAKLDQIGVLIEEVRKLRNLPREPVTSDTNKDSGGSPKPAGKQPTFTELVEGLREPTFSVDTPKPPPASQPSAPAPVQPPPQAPKQATTQNSIDYSIKDVPQTPVQPEAQTAEMPNERGALILVIVIAVITCFFSGYYGTFKTLNISIVGLLEYPRVLMGVMASGFGGVVLIPLIGAWIHSAATKKSFRRCYINWQWGFIALVILLAIVRSTIH